MSTELKIKVSCFFFLFIPPCSYCYCCCDVRVVLGSKIRGCRRTSSWHWSWTSVDQGTTVPVRRRRTPVQRRSQGPTCSRGSLWDHSNGTPKVLRLPDQEGPTWTLRPSRLRHRRWWTPVDRCWVGVYVPLPLSRLTVSCGPGTTVDSESG